MHGSELELKAMHGGLETVVIGDKFSGMNMISIGLTFNFPHFPEELVHLTSVKKFYDYLKGLLEKL